MTDQVLDVLDSRMGQASRIAEKATSANTARTAHRLVAFVCLALIAVNVWLVVSSRSREVAQLTLANEKLASSIAQQVDSSLLDIEHMLEDIVFQLEQGNVGPSLLERLQPSLVSKAARVEQLQGIFIYDATGRWMLTSEPVPSDDLNNSDRDYFDFHRSNPSHEAHLGLPIVSRSTGEWIIPLSRRLNDANGDFAGVVLATLKLNYYKQVLGKFKLGEDGATALALDGHILVRVPYKESDVRRALKNQPIVKQAERMMSGSNEERSSIDHVLRILSFDHAPNFPVVVIVAVGQDEVLQNWLKASIVQSLVVLGLCLLTLAGGQRLVRSVRRREQVEHRLRVTGDALANANEKLANLARDDGLTGIPNRRFFDMRLAKLFGHALRHKRPLAVVMVDVDYFKAFNDRYGHVAGDDCLRRVAAAIRDSVHRPEDLVARYGGEEFGLLLPDTDAEGARHVAEAARLAMESLEIAHDGSPHGQLTVSLGIATINAAAMTEPAQLVAVADQALYKAKNAGRNLVVGGI